MLKVKKSFDIAFDINLKCVKAITDLTGIKDTFDSSHSHISRYLCQTFDKRRRCTMTKSDGICLQSKACQMFGWDVWVPCCSTSSWVYMPRNHAMIKMHAFPISMLIGPYRALLSQLFRSSASKILSWTHGVGRGGGEMWAPWLISCPLSNFSINHIIWAIIIHWIQHSFNINIVGSMLL